MGWSGSLNANSAIGSAITFTPNTTTEGGYTVSAFAAPKKGIYRFILRGSGGSYNGYHDDGVSAAGGTGGLTTGYLLLEAGQTVYIGAGGTCSAAFVSKINVSNLAATGSKDNLYFVAGAGGGGGANWGQQWGMKAGTGGVGGGTTGGVGNSAGHGTSGAGGTQTGPGSNTTAGAYGQGKGGGYSNSDDISSWGGRGGDGLYGGAGGWGSQGGGGGSGYIYTDSIKVGSNTYTNATQQGGGAGSATVGSAEVTYYAAAELPVSFNGTKLMKIIFDGTEVKSLIYNGTKLFMERLRRAVCRRIHIPMAA